MRISRWGGAAVAGATVAAMAVLPITAAHAAAASYTIQVGGDSTVSGAGFEGMRFLAPPNMTVHKGDTITFQFAGFHTATLIPAGVGAEDWRQDHTTFPSGDYTLVQQDTDDTNTFMFNNKYVFPSDPTCGTASNPCPYDGKSVVNSGLPLSASSFTVTINAQPGSTFWVLCLVHGGMETRISVVDDATTTTTQDQVNTYAAQTVAADHEQAAAQIPVLEKPTSHKLSNGHRVWTAFAGFDGNGWGLDGMFPKKLTITKGDTVAWHFRQLMGNIHTVTFPKAAAASYADNDFSGNNAKCEGANGGPDTAPDAPPPAFCSSGIQNLEFEIPGQAILPTGGHTYGGSGYRTSGVAGPDGLTTAPYTLTFTKASPKSGFTYACSIHGAMMNGAVIVKSS